MKRVLIVLFGAILFGGICAFFVFNNTVKADKSYDEFIAFQIGVYSNYDNALRIADRNNGIVVLDNDLYRVFVSVLKEEEAISKMKSYYDGIGLNYYLKEVMILKDFGTDIEVYEEMIEKSSSDTYNTLNKDILKVYENYI